MGRQTLPGRQCPRGRRNVLPQGRRATETACVAGRALPAGWLLAKPSDEGPCLCPGRRLHAWTPTHFMGNGHLAILRSTAGQLKYAIADVRSSDVRSDEKSRRQCERYCTRGKARRITWAMAKPYPSLSEPTRIGCAYGKTPVIAMTCGKSASGAGYGNAVGMVALSLNPDFYLPFCPAHAD